MYCSILPINVRIDMIYLFGLCDFAKLSNICHHDLLKVLKHPIRIDRLINMTFEHVNHRCQHRTWLNTCVLSKPSIHKYCKYPQAIHNYYESLQMKPVAILYRLPLLPMSRLSRKLEKASQVCLPSPCDPTRLSHLYILLTEDLGHFTFFIGHRSFYTG